MSEEEKKDKTREPRANKKSKPSAINRAIGRGKSKGEAIVDGLKFKNNVKSSRKDKP